MKLQLGMPFEEHMVLKQNVTIPVWGTSVRNDTITICIGDKTYTTYTENGEWQIDLPAMPASFKARMEVSSKRTGETIIMNDVAIGEVILAGGQSNMEFILKYDESLEEALKYEDDHDLRCFTVPQSSFVGFLEKQPTPDWGYWRTFEDSEDRKQFSAVACHLGLALRKKLNVPVGIISCNWGGTPATAWIDHDSILANPALKPVLDWQDNADKSTAWESYIKTAFVRTPEPSEEMKAFNEKFMMGEDMSEFFKAGPPPMDPTIYSPYLPGPLSCIRPASLYENMLCKVAPYPVSFIIWWQGEDDDARDWVDFYDESMYTLIRSWRKLFNEELAFFQVELAPFKGIGPTGAKHYDVMRHKQFEATSRLDKAYDICILDAGEEFNIHPRHKKIVGERLANYVFKYVYDIDVNADCPLFEKAVKDGNRIILSFANTYGAIEISDKLKNYLEVECDGKSVDYVAYIEDDRLILEGDFKGKISIRYCEANYCEASIFNAEHNPLFGFTAVI